MRVSSGPEIGAYYHEFFLRDKPQLAAQMFCKNARSKLAMATETTAKPAVVVPQESIVAPQQLQQEQPSSSAAFFASFQQKLPDTHVKAFPSYGNNTLQMLQRQMDMLQQERAQRMFLERAVRQSTMLPPVQHQQVQHQRQHQQQQQPATSNARLMQMQQFMDMQMQQRQGRAPTNPRASAA